MDNRIINEFIMLLKRELWENKNLFIAAPLVLSGLLLFILIWMLTQLQRADVGEIVSRAVNSLDGIGTLDIAPFLTPLAAPFMVVFFVCTIIYLVNTLYQDRKDGSVLFWQSMPISNLSTVLSKIATVCIVAPLFIVVAVFVLLLFSVTVMAVYGFGSGIGLAGLGSFLLAGLYSLILIYLTGVLSTLWFFPVLAWMLLFSAYSRNLPFLWAVGGFLLLPILEDLIFGSQFMGNWINSRRPDLDSVVFSIPEFFQRLFSYDMLIGIALGSLLLCGAVVMRRFTD